MLTLVGFFLTLCGWLMILGQAQPKPWSLRFWIIFIGGVLIFVGGMLVVIASEVQR